LIPTQNWTGQRAERASPRDAASATRAQKLAPRNLKGKEPAASQRASPRELPKASPRDLKEKGPSRASPIVLPRDADSATRDPNEKRPRKGGSFEQKYYKYKIKNLLTEMYNITI